MDEIAPGLFHWSAHHPDIDAEVHSHLLIDGGVLLDPMLPEGGLDALPARPQVIVLTARMHRRQIPEILAGLGDCPVRVHQEGLHQYDDDDAIDPVAYGPGDELAPGVEVLELGAIAPDDAVLHLHAVRALAFGDGLISEGGQLGFVPDALMDDPDAVKARTRTRAGELAGLAPEILCFAHGAPIRSGGATALHELAEQD